MTPDISVVIPTFRRPEGLKEALGSALRQADVSVEAIVVDDSPEGSGAAVVAALGDPRIRYLQNPVPTGGYPSIVRNLGWPLARAPLVHLLDDDDRVAEGHYAAVLRAFADHPGVGLVYGRIEPFGSGPAAQLDAERRYFAAAARRSAFCARFGSRWAYVGRMLFDDALLICSASVVRREHVVNLDGFDPKIRLMEDADFHLRVMRVAGARFLDRPAVHYRIGAPSLMHSPDAPESQWDEVRQGRRSMQAKYRREHGLIEFYVLAALTRAALRLQKRFR
jgi:GT2 family glycosyltransferase